MDKKKLNGTDYIIYESTKVIGMGEHKKVIKKYKTVLFRFFFKNV